jgi:hypothetical protein
MRTLSENGQFISANDADIARNTVSANVALKGTF